MVIRPAQSFLPSAALSTRYNPSVVWRRTTMLGSIRTGALIGAVLLPTAGATRDRNGRNEARRTREMRMASWER
jgi:hypothetical protein